MIGARAESATRAPSRRGFLAAGAGLALSACARPAALDADVVILGAGLAGLNAALTLEGQGLSVLVLEADARVGGRARTLDEAPGRPEAGGQDIGPLYGRARHLVKRFGLALTKPMGGQTGFSLVVGGRLIDPKAWVNAPENRVGGEARPIPPMRLESWFMDKGAQIDQGTGYRDPANAALDQPYGAYLASLGADPEALRLIAAQAPMDSLDMDSALWEMKRRAVRNANAGAGELEFLLEGVSRLPEAMAGALKGALRLKTPARAIDIAPDKVTVRLGDGGAVSARFAISTLPFSVLREMAITPAPPAAQAELIAALPYGQATSVFLPVLGDYWSGDGLGASMWTDSDLGRVFLSTNKDGQHLWVFMTGKTGSRARAMPVGEVAAFAKGEIERLRPAAKGKLGAGATFCWSRHPWAKGTFAFRAPGQITRLEPSLAAPHGRLFFAGEHTAVAAPGLEGALESGERAAFEILELV